jgi:hypothetical protein
MREFGQLVTELAVFESMGLTPLDALMRLRARLRGDLTHESTVCGRLVHPGGAPIMGLDVELWDSDIGNGDDFLGASVSATDGTFEITYRRADAGYLDSPDIVLRIYEPAQEYRIEGHLFRRRVQVERIRGELNVSEDKHDMGSIELEYYEYDSKAKFPYTTRSSLRRDFVPGAATRFYESLGKWGAVHNRAVLRLKAGLELTPGEIQALYPQTTTILKESADPGSTRSDTYFGQRILAGFFPAQFLRRHGDETGLHLAFDWSEFTLNGALDLPNMAARFELRDDLPLPTEIVLQFREGDSNNSRPLRYKEPQKWFPNEPGWAEAKRVFRTIYFGVYGQLYGHVALAHFNLEQYAIAMNRNLRHSPLRSILMPHLKEVSNINDKGRTLLLGADDGLFAQAKPITLDSQLNWLTSNIGRCDWYSWSPRKPVSSADVYAHIATVYWAALGEYLEGEFDSARGALETHWNEVVAFEQDLLQHAVQFTRRPMEMPDGYDWADQNEVSKDHGSRAWRGGVEGAVTPFSDSGRCDDHSLANLRQLCAYCIFHATFVHGWFHEQQNPEFGEILYASMLTGGSFGPEEDRSLLPSGELLSLGLRTTHTLTGFDWGFLLKNEDGDVPSGLINAVRARKDEFEAMGYDINRLRSRLNS